MKISSISLKHRTATTFDWNAGLRDYEITKMLDDDGDETTDIDAVKVIVVKESEDKWHTVDIRNFIEIVGS